MSTLEAGMHMRTKLLESQRAFYIDAQDQAVQHPVKAYVFTETEDSYRLNEFISNLLKHQIKVYELGKDVTKDGVMYKAGSGFIVPLNQNEYRFIRSLFEPVTSFTDSVFYDISTWVLPLSFNINSAPITSSRELEGMIGKPVMEPLKISGKLIAGTEPYAYLFEWNEYLSPKALHMLQKAGIRTRVATDRFTINDVTIKKIFSYGTIMIPSSGQSLPAHELRKLVEQTAHTCGLDIYGISTGMTPSGIDLGSNMFVVLQKPSVLMFVGDGISSTDAGEIWHLLDTRFNMNITMVTSQKFQDIELSKYNVLIVAGSPSLSSSSTEKIKEWNIKGGTIIAYKTGNIWLSRNKIAKIEFIPSVIPKTKTEIYANRAGDSRVHQIPGSIFEAQLDLTHPLCYGYSKDRLPVFKSGESAASPSEDRYSNPAVYTSVPLLSGYCSKENTDRIKNSSFVSVHGRRVISIYDNTNFRSITYGTTKIFMNAIFFGQIL
jgi:hypothetical protein